MKIFYLLKKHYVATLLFIVGLALTGYSGYALYHKPIQTKDEAIPHIKTTQIPEATQNPNIKKNKNTVAEVKKIEITATSTAEAPTSQNPNFPVDLSSGTFIILGKTYPVQFIENSSVYQVLKQLNDEGKITINFKDYSGLGYFVDGIDGIHTDTVHAKYWIYYINGAKAQIGISNYFLKQNDVITWKYENAE